MNTISNITNNTTDNVNTETNNNYNLEEICKEKFPFVNRDKALNNINTADNNNDKYDFNKLIWDKEAERAIFETRNKRHTGAEGLRFETLNRAIRESTYIKEAIIMLTKMSIYTGKLPSNATTSLGKIIPKKNPGQYRIVHMSTPISVIIEQIILHRLEYDIQEKHLYHPNQFGFVPEKGRHDLITKLIASITENKNTHKNKARTCLISMDIQGAFDNVSHEVIITKLFNSFNKDNPIIQWISNFLIDKNIVLSYKNKKTKPVSICQGVPQGSSLGPILWNFTINDLTTGLDDQNTNILAYADDILIVHHDNGHSNPQQIVNTILNRLEHLKLRVSPEKSAVMFISESRIRNTKQNKILIYGQQINNVTQMNILGVKINHNQLKLNLTESLNDEKLKNNILKLHKIAQLNVINTNKEWRTLIDAYIRSKLIINNLPILAIDHSAIYKTETHIARILKFIFSWPKNTSNKLIFLILNQISIKTTITKAIGSKLDTEHNQYYKTLEKAFQNKTTEQQTHQNSLQKTRKYCDPTHIILKTENKLNKPYWIMKENRSHSKIMLIGTKSKKQIAASHYSHKNSYMNTLALLYLINNDPHCLETGEKEKQYVNNICFAESNSLYSAICNPNNRDGRILQIRENINLNGITLEHINNNRYKQIIDQETKNYKETRCQIRTLNQPNINDYKNRFYNRLQINKMIKNERRNYMTKVCKDLNPNENNWSDLVPNWLSGKKMLTLTGLTNKPTGTITIGRTTDCDCGHHGSTESYTIHKLKECKLVQLNDNNDRSTEMIRIIRDTENSQKLIGDMLKNRMGQQRLLSTISKIAFD